MQTSKNALSFLESACVQQFGQETGQVLLKQTEDLYLELLKNVSPSIHPAIQDHLQFKLLPMLAYYKCLRNAGLDQEQALEYVRQETRKTASVQKERMEKLGRLPFAYTMFRLGAKQHLQKHFPDCGWETEWVPCGPRELCFRLHRCLYWELTKAQHCPELCGVFCENDTITFSGLLPRIRFERSGTLASGAAYCDFHFLRAR